MTIEQFYRYCWMRGFDWRDCKSAGWILDASEYNSLDQDDYHTTCDTLTQSMKEHFLAEVFGE